MPIVDILVPWSGTVPYTLVESFIAPALLQHPGLGSVVWIGPEAPGGCAHVPTDRPRGGCLLSTAINLSPADYFLLARPDTPWSCSAESLERLLDTAQATGAGMVYGDYLEAREDELVSHPTIDRQLGSLRDDFDFGPVALISRAKADNALRRQDLAETVWAGAYELSLRLSEVSGFVHLPEPLSIQHTLDARSSGEKGFDYVDPQNRKRQEEMEYVASGHLRRIGAYLEPKFDAVPEPKETFPVEMSVVIPVRNRERTVSEAIRSALDQNLNASHNVLVVDNHSSDKTTELVSDLAASDKRVVHLIPERRDLGIGGCWNLAIADADCGRYAVQLDSDDLYEGNGTLQAILEAFRSGGYAMVIGSYSLVDFDLNAMPPGLIDHREWTRENGRNNALRINGLGAPRAFQTHLLRRHPLPNVSYGEDYAVGLRLSRQYELGRIYDSLYLCRRWEGNTDSALSVEAVNRHNLYKDRLRTLEIGARQRMNAAER